MFALMVKGMGRSMSLSLLRKVVDYYCYHYFDVNASTASQNFEGWPCSFKRDEGSRFRP